MESEDKHDKIALRAGELKLLMDRTLNRFTVEKVWIDESPNMIRLVINFDRLTLSFWISVFIPSICLILAAEITLFIDEKYFEATIMVSLTSNLVMYTLYNAIQQELPADSSIKLIDIWLLHGLLMPMVVFIILCVNELIKSNSINILGRNKKSKTGKRGKKSRKRGFAFMKICKVAVPTISAIFMVTFFVIGILHQISVQDTKPIT